MKRCTLTDFKHKYIFSGLNWVHTLERWNHFPWTVDERSFLLLVASFQPIAGTLCKGTEPEIPVHNHVSTITLSMQKPVWEIRGENCVDKYLYLNLAPWLGTSCCRRRSHEREEVQNHHKPRSLVAGGGQLILLQIKQRKSSVQIENYLTFPRRIDASSKIAKIECDGPPIMCCTLFNIKSMNVPNLAQGLSNVKHLFFDQM